MTSVARETLKRPCSKCGAEPRAKNQRWGRKCLNEAQRRHYHRTKISAVGIREILKRLEAENG